MSTNEQQDSPQAEQSTGTVRKDGDSQVVSPSDLSLDISALEAFPVFSEEVTSAMKKLPPEVQKEFYLSISQQRFGAMPNPILSQITPEHIDKMIDVSDKDSERDLKDRNRDRWTHVFYTILFVGYLSFLFGL